MLHDSLNKKNNWRTSQFDKVTFPVDKEKDKADPYEIGKNGHQGEQGEQVEISPHYFYPCLTFRCTFCGITMKQFVEANVSQKSHTTIKYFLKMLASVCETIIFMLLGISTVVDNHEWDTAFVVLVLLFCLVYRTIGETTVCLVLSCQGSKLTF